MKKNNIIKPTGLKGTEALNRVRELMNLQPITEATKSSSVVELSKLGPDGKVYGIVREKHEFYIKVAENKQTLINEDFKYIGGLQNKKSNAYPTYAEALKKLNLKFISINESLGKSGQVNVFTNDNLITETKSAGSMGFTNEGNLEGNEDLPIEEEVELTEVEQAIDEMNDKEYGLEEVAVPKSTSKLKIESAMEMMDDAIEDEDSDDKIAKLAETLSESELERLIALKKKS
jgi:hypothetical protein